MTDLSSRLCGKLCHALVLFAALLLVSGSGPVAADSLNVSNSSTPISRMLADSDGLSTQTSLSDATIASRFKSIATASFSLQTMARDALGYDRFRQLGAEQKAAYAKAFVDHLAQGFVLGVRRHGAVVSKVLGTRTGQNGAAIVISRSRISGREKDTFWHMCREHPALVCDIEVDGIRASARQRAAFSRVLEEHGFERLLTDLRSGDLAGRIS